MMSISAISECSTVDEARRLEALARYQILDTPREAAFDEIVEVASLICEAPLAAINFIDRDRQWFKSFKGLAAQESPLDTSICAHALLQPGLLIVPDTKQDPRFATNPLVTGEPHLRFYAGALLESHDGYPLGTLCVLDHMPRKLSEHQRFALQALANQVMAHMELMRSHREQELLIQELEATREELARQATTDPLTGLLNRRAFERRMHQELALSGRSAAHATFLMFDLDHFKRINDKYGHQVGDEVLVRVAESCRDTLRDTDVVARWGGEEFAVLMPHTSMSYARHAATRLQERLASVCIEAIADNMAQVPVITASIGICSLSGKRDLNDCIQRADALLYQAKAEGRNRAVSDPPY